MKLLTDSFKNKERKNKKKVILFGVRKRLYSIF